MKLILLLSTLFAAGTTIVAQQSRQILSSPQHALPASAVESGLGGTVNVEVEVNKAGEETKVGDAVGPDWVCPSVTRPDVLALRETAKLVAKDTKFAASEKNSKLWIGVKFPFGKPRDEIYNPGVKPAEPARENSTKVPRLINAGVVNGRAKKMGRPVYPPEARSARVSGAVSIKVLIDEDGSIFSAEPVGGHPLLHGSSRAAACSTEFSQTRLMGQAVRVSGVITYNFVP